MESVTFHPLNLKMISSFYCQYSQEHHHHRERGRAGVRGHRCDNEGKLRMPKSPPFLRRSFSTHQDENLSVNERRKFLLKKDQGQEQERTTRTMRPIIPKSMMPTLSMPKLVGGGSSSGNSRKTNRRLITPRPMMVSMLNNKGVILMENKQYDEASQTLNKALKMIESDNHNHKGKEKSSSLFRFPFHINYHKQKFTSTAQEGTKPSLATPLLPPPSTATTHTPNDDTTDEAGSLTTKVASTTCTDPFELLSSWSASSSSPSSSTSSVSSSSSDSQQESESATYDPRRSDYQEGMDWYKNPIRLHDTTTTTSSKASGSSSSVDGTILFNLGRVSHNQGKYEDAFDLYKRAMLAIERCWTQNKKKSVRSKPHRPEAVDSTNDHNNPLSTNESLMIAVLFGIGHVQYIKGEHMNSLRTYMTAMSIARSTSNGKLDGEGEGETPTSSLEIAASLNCIGVLHYVMPNGDNDAALDALQQALEIRRLHLGENHIDVGTTYNNIGRVQFQFGRYDDALTAYREALRIRRLCEGNNSIDTAATIFNTAQVYHQQGHDDQALRLYKQFLRLAKLNFGDYHRDICVVATCIGQIFQDQKEYERSLKALNISLRVARVVLGKIHPEIAITLNKLGNLYYEVGDLDSALKAYEQGLEVELETLDEDDPNLYVTYTNIAEIYKQQGDLDHAIEIYEKVLKIQRDHNEHIADIAHTLSSIGYIHHHKGEYDEALEVNQECLRLRREANGNIDEDVASTLTHIALVLLKMERHYDIALEVLSEAYKIRLALKETTDIRNLAFTLYNIALVYHHRGEHEEALKFYLETERIEKSALGNDRRDLSITYYNLGQIYYQRGELELALTKFREALKIEKDCFGSDDPTCARTLNEIGNVELQLGNLPAVMECYGEAMRIYRKAGIADDRLVVYAQKLWRWELVQPPAAPVA